MGFLDFIKKTQKKRKRATSIGKTGNSAADQILALRKNLIRNKILEYQVIANRDCCSVCNELNEKHFPVKKLVIGVNAPPIHEGCRCSIAAYQDEAEFEKWLDFLEKGGTTKEYNKIISKKK